jgi:hypothetical protein
VNAPARIVGVFQVVWATILTFPSLAVVPELTISFHHRGGTHDPRARRLEAARTRNIPWKKWGPQALVTSDEFKTNDLARECLRHLRAVLNSQDLD